MVEMLLQGQAKALAQKAVDLAMAGDTVALKICIERLIPRAHERTLSFSLPVVAAPKDAAAALAAIVKGVGAGELSAGEGKQLVSLIEASLKALELTDIEQRLAKLEEAKR